MKNVLETDCQDEMISMISASIINETERMLLRLLARSLNGVGSVDVSSISAEEWEQIYEIAQRHEVLTLLENIIDPDKLSVNHRTAMQQRTVRTVHKAISLQALCSRLTGILEKEGITAVTLKGFAVARLYPVPEFRKTTDADLFLFSKQDAEKAANILCENGFKFSDEQHANHHFVMISENNESVELHSAWAENFKEKHLNQYLEKLRKESVSHILLTEYDQARIYVYETAWQGFYLLIHMLQHFTASGFGLRNLCDWAVLWENCYDEKARRDFAKMACDSHTAEFAKVLTAVCVKYLGLSREKSPFPDEFMAKNDVTDALLRDVLDAGEFGYSERERMVGMDGNSLMAYIREFHHQMHINFPKAGKVILFWPVLWIATLVRFLANNKRLHRAPFSAIMKKAGNRGRLVRQLMPNGSKKGG